MTANPTKVPFVDLKAQYAQIADEVHAAIGEVMKNTAFVKGRYVSEFESAFAAYCGAAHALGVANGTDALHVALRAIGVGPGDEVIVPANSFIATAEAVTMTGATVVFADVDAQTYNLDVGSAADKITSRTKAIVPVHLYGQPADMHAVCELARKHGLKVVQDCAQAHGATVDGQPVADFGDVLCFSFYPGKNLGAYGDAGAIASNDEAIVKRAEKYANHGQSVKYEHDIVGVNSRLDAMQAAVLQVKLGYIEEWTEMRRANAARYDDLLSGLEGIVTPHAVANVRHVYHLYVIRVPDRVAVMDALSAADIACGLHYPITLPNAKAYAHLGHAPQDFPVATRLQDEILSLPMYPELTEPMIERVAATIKSLR